MNTRTQKYIAQELRGSGYSEEDILLFNGDFDDAMTKEIYRAWQVKNFGKTNYGRAVEYKHAIVDYFKSNAKILIVTDYAAPYEGNFINNSCPLDNDSSDNSELYNYCEYGTGAGEFFVANDPEDFGIKYVFSVNGYGPDTQGVTIKTYNDENGETKTVYTLSHADFKSGLNGGNHVWYRPDELLFLDSNERFIFDVATEFAYTGEISQKSFDRLENEFSPEVQEDVLNALAELGDNPSYYKMQQVAFRLYKTYVNSVKTNVPWIYLGEYDEATMNNSYLRKTVEYYSNFFTQNFTETGATYCRYHTININWNPDNNQSTTQNQCYYDGGIDIPDDPVKPGYTFTGWKLVE